MVGAFQPAPPHMLHPNAVYGARLLTAALKHEVSLLCHIYSRSAQISVLTG